MKKILMCLFALMLVLSIGMCLAACNTDEGGNEGSGNDENNETPGTGDSEDDECEMHFDTDGDELCDVCGAEYVAEDGMIDFTVTVVDEAGEPIEGAVVEIMKSGVTVESGTTGADGKITVSIVGGSYTVMITDGLPENFIAGITEVNVNNSENNAEITVVDNTPDGSSDKPYAVTNEYTDYTLPTGGKLHFTMRGAEATLVVFGKNVKVTVNENEYTSDGGRIDIDVASVTDITDTFAQLTFTVEGIEGDIVNIGYEYLPGTSDNPLSATLDNLVGIEVPKDKTVYFKWTADEAGILMLTSPTPTNNIMLYNLDTYNATAYTSGASGTYIRVGVGDTVSVAIASLSSDERSTVEFKLVLYAASETDPLPLLIGENYLNYQAGEAISYVYRGMSGTLAISGEDVTVTVNGEAAELTDGKLDVTDGDVITVTNNSDEASGITVTLSESAEEDELETA